MVSQLARFLQKHKKATIAVILLVFCICLVLIKNGNFSNNILDMLPVEDRIIAQHVRVLSVFSTMDRVMFELTASDSTTDFNRLAETARKTMSLLAGSNRFDFPQTLSAADFFALRNLIIRRWPDLFTPEDSVWVAARLNADSLSRRLEHTLSGLFTLGDPSASAFMLQHDPFNLSSVAFAKLAAFKPAEGITIEDGLITNTARTRVLFFAKTRQSGMSAEYARSVERVIDTVQKHAASRGFTLTWMGALRATGDNNAIIKRDIHLTLPVAVLLIFVICLSVYRRISFGFLTLIPTVLGIGATMALFTCFGKLSIIIIGFGAALLGITVDYAIHYLYQVDDCPEDTDPVKTLTGPVFASAFTTSGAFLVLILAGIPRLAQLGMVTATGIIFVALLSLVILPVFITTPRVVSNRKPRILLPEILGKVYRQRLDRLLLISLFVVVVACVFFIPRLSFDGDPDNLNGMKKKTVEIEKAFSRNWPGIQSGTYLAVTDTSFEAVSRKTEQRIQPLVNHLLDKKLIAPATPYTKLIPSRQMQERNRLRWSRTFTSEIRDEMRSVIRAGSAHFAIEPTLLYRYCSDILSKDSLPVLGVEDFPEVFRDGILTNVVNKDDSLWYATVAVFPEAVHQWSTIDSLAKEFSVLAVNDDSIGLRVVEIIKNGFVKCLMYIPLVIVCILFGMLRDVRAVVITLIPILLATVITLGVMALFAISVNIVTLMIFAFLFGLGIDYAVLMVFMGVRGLKEGKDYMPHAAASITVAAGTTLAGLGILALARHPVLAVLGKTGLIGIISSYLCAVILVPVLLKKFGKVSVSVNT